MEMKGGLDTLNKGMGRESERDGDLVIFRRVKQKNGCKCLERESACCC